MPLALKPAYIFLYLRCHWPWRASDAGLSRFPGHDQ